MQKRPFLILSLILTVAGIVYMVLEHNGYFREKQLHKNTTEYYINQLSKKEKPCKERVIVAFSSIGNENTEQFRVFLHSILDQTVAVDDISIFLPYKNMGNIPKSLKTVLTMKACDENKNSCAYGICVEREKTTRIIFVSPDVIYPADFIQTMCETCDKNPDCIIYGNKNRSVSGGILVKPELLSNSVVDTNNVSDISKWISDNFGNKFVVCPEL